MVTSLIVVFRRRSPYIFSSCSSRGYEFLTRGIKNVIKKIIIPEDKWEFSNLRNWGGESERHFGKNCFYPIYVDMQTMQVIDIGYPEKDSFHPEKQTIVIEQDGKRIYKVYPIDKKGIERKWRYARDTLIDLIQKYPKAIKAEKSGERVEIKIAQVVERLPTCWDLEKYDAGNYGTNIITDLFGKKVFDFSKSIWTTYDSIKFTSNEDSIVLDFFAGSGTTAHAVALLNTKDTVDIINKIIALQQNIKKLKDKKTIEKKKEQLRELEEKLRQIEFEKRKYILVEINDYFDTIIIPRIKKLMYSLVWEKGKPQYPFGYSHIFKYLYLEQYEDLLDLYGDLNIEENDHKEFIFAKDFAKLTEKRILPLLLNPINGSYDLLETYLFHNAMSLKSVSYKEGVLRAELIDRYEKKVLMLLSNDKEKLIERLNFEDFSPYDRVVANIDHPDLEKIKKDPEKIEFIKKKDLAGV